MNTTAELINDYYKWKSKQPLIIESNIFDFNIIKTAQDEKINKIPTCEELINDYYKWKSNQPLNYIYQIKKFF